MERLDIEYDFLPRESEILHLHFWDAAFAKLKEAGVLTYEASGKNKGCWIMRRGGTAAAKTFTTGGTEGTGEKCKGESVASAVGGGKADGKSDGKSDHHKIT